MYVCIYIHTYMCNYTCACKHDTIACNKETRASSQGTPFHFT